MDFEWCSDSVLSVSLTLINLFQYISFFFLLVLFSFCFFYILENHKLLYNLQWCINIKFFVFYLYISGVNSTLKESKLFLFWRYRGTGFGLVKIQNTFISSRVIFFWKYFKTAFQSPKFIARVGIFNAIL